MFTIKIYIVKEKITVIIPTHNYRQGLLNRLLDYYSTYPVKIIIEDGSSKKNNAKFNKNISYYHSPKKEFVMRIKHALENCKTKYVAINQDDDFLIFSSLEKGKKFLDLNKNYSFVSGNIFYFEFFFNSIIHKSVYQINSLKSNSSKSSNTRLLNFFSQPQMLVASLFKRNDLLENLNLYEKFIKKIIPQKRSIYGEFAFSMFMFSKFNYKYLNLIWQFRDRNVYPFERLSNKKNLSRPINSTILDKDTSEFKIFKKEIDKIFRVEKKIDLENLLVDFLKNYIKDDQSELKSYNIKKNIRSHSPKLANVLRYINRFIRLALFDRSTNLKKKYVLNKINKNEYTKFLDVLKKHKKSINKLKKNN